MCGELEQRSRGNGGSWWEPGQSEQEERQGALTGAAKGLQGLTTELAALELEIAAVHPNVQREAKRLRDVAQLAALRNGGGGVGWRDTDTQREACRLAECARLSSK